MCADSGLLRDETLVYVQDNAEEDRVWSYFELPKEGTVGPDGTEGLNTIYVTKVRTVLFVCFMVHFFMSKVPGNRLLTLSESLHV